MQYHTHNLIVTLLLLVNQTASGFLIFYIILFLKFKISIQWVLFQSNECFKQTRNVFFLNKNICTWKLWWKKMSTLIRLISNGCQQHLTCNLEWLCIWQIYIQNCWRTQFKKNDHCKESKLWYRKVSLIINFIQHCFLFNTKWN